VSACKSHAFAFVHTFAGRDPAPVIAELQSYGLTGVNLALNYHASRDFLLRQGPRLEYLKDGFNYYSPNLSFYPESGLRPSLANSYDSNDELNSLILKAREVDFEISAWGVFLHNGNLGASFPDCSVENALGNRFLSELCPSNPRVQSYSRGLAEDLLSRGINSLAIESLHFHGARHGEHHERFFLEMSPITEFLLSLCFCSSCLDRFAEANGDGARLKSQVAAALDEFLRDQDPWLGVELSKEHLADICGPEMFAYLVVREATVSSLYGEITQLAHSYGATTRLIDQTPLLDMTSSESLHQSWVLGINPQEVRKYIDIYEPLIYRNDPTSVEKTTSHYLEQLGGAIIPILRPTFPDNLSKPNLIAKVQKIRGLGVGEIDFYLLDTMRPRDLTWIKEALL